MEKLTIILLLINIVTATAQEVKTSTIKWNAQSTLEANEGRHAEEITSFTTYATSRMEWKEANGSIRKNFQIIEVIGEWMDASQQGWLQYKIKDGASHGTVSIRRNQTETKIFIALASDPPLSYILTIMDHQIL